jgi:hypothetical protein
LISQDISKKKAQLSISYFHQATTPSVVASITLPCQGTIGEA